MDRFDTMLAFTRVVELNSFTKAALSLNIPKATLSAQVANLEKRLNVKLFHRTTRHVSVTTDGAVYYERAIRLLSDLEETESVVTQSNLTYRGRLRVDTSGTLGRQIILPALNDFFRRYPEIELELGCTDRTVDLLQEGIDCAIRGGMPIDESLVARKLVETRLVTCATPTYLEQHGTPNTLEDLKQHMVVNFLSPRTGKVVGFNYSNKGKKVEVYGRRRIAVNDIDSCVSATLADIGIAQLPFFSVRDHLQSGSLVRLLADYPGELATAYVVYLQNRHLSANVRAFIDWTVNLFEKEQQNYFNCCPDNQIC
ncbi:MAG TPA: LysR substrate-binding domain-containing protein [Methylotenera sp.]|nr:LysR substrate-binding domain-containing protein [Methylotenera sp.]